MSALQHIEQRSTARNNPHAAASELAKRGFFVFPITHNRKSPPLVQDWENAATTECAQIDKWASEFAGCNWGWAPGRTDHVVFDLDRKNGKDGVAELRTLGAKHGFDLSTALSIETPTGGLHLVTVGIAQTSAGRIAPGIDVRARGGYVVAPGSVIDGKAYKIVNDVDMWELPNAPAALLELNERKLSAPSASPLAGVPFSPAQLTEMLAHLDPDCPRDEWRDIAAALHAAPCTDPEFDKRHLFVRWSRGEVIHG